MSKVGVDDFLLAHGPAALEALAVAASKLNGHGPVVAVTLPFQTARALAQRTPARPEFIVPPWAARGAITEIANHSP